MNSDQLKYHFLRILIWIGLSELTFWSVFFLSNVGVALFKGEPWKSSFTVYQHPEFLWLLLSLPFVYGLYLFNLSWKNNVLGKHFSPNLQRFLLQIPTEKWSFLRFFIIRTVLVLTIFALANPQGGARKIGVDGFVGELVVAVDVSRSMLVRDMEGGRSRMDAMKNGLNNLTKNISGASVGIVVFAGTAFTHMPMTRDLQAVNGYIDDISTDIISEQGTNLAEAITVAARSFSTTSSTKLIYLISDGEDHEDGVEEAIAFAKSQGAIVHVVALGSERGGPIPMKEGGVKRDKDNEIIISVPNLELLRNVAQQTQGMYWHETTAFPNFGKILNQSFQLIANERQIESKMRKSYGAAFAFFAFLLLLTYMTLLNFNLFEKKNEE